VTVAASHSAGTPASRPTLACAGAAKKRAIPGRAARLRELGLNDEEWRRLAKGWIGIVVEQGTLPGPGGLQRADADQRRNHDDLRARGF
jgi:hypothetical protein